MTADNVIPAGSTIWVVLLLAGVPTLFECQVTEDTEDRSAFKIRTTIGLLDRPWYRDKRLAEIAALRWNQVLQGSIDAEIDALTEKLALLSAGFLDVRCINTTLLATQ